MDTDEWAGALVDADLSESEEDEEECAARGRRAPPHGTAGKRVTRPSEARRRARRVNPLRRQALDRLRRQNMRKREREEPSVGELQVFLQLLNPTLDAK